MQSREAIQTSLMKEVMLSGVEVKGSASSGWGGNWEEHESEDTASDERQVTILVTR